MWKEKFTYFYTLLIIQCLQKINEAKVNNLRNKTHTHVFLINMMIKHQVNSRVILIKKGKARKFWKRESFKTWLYASLTIYNVWVHIITSTQGVEVVKIRKKTCILHVATFLEHHRIIRKWRGVYRGKFFRTYAYNLWTGRFVNNSSQHMKLYEKQHLFWNHKQSAKFNNTYMYAAWKDTCTVLYLHSERIDRWNPGSYDKLASAGNDLCSIATCIVGDTAGLLC